jgi:hypothetical protein
MGVENYVAMVAVACSEQGPNSPVVCVSIAGVEEVDAVERSSFLLTGEVVPTIHLISTALTRAAWSRV